MTPPRSAFGAPGGPAEPDPRRPLGQPTPAFLLADLAPLAHEQLGDAAWAYLAGGAADGLTLDDNACAWRRLRLSPRVLRPLAGGHTRSTLLGRPLPHPVLLAPVAYQTLFHPDGERASALAAAMQGAGLVLSAHAGTPRV
ncbi:MAG: alpha-hydroxy-acid oxidizing protein, partial [Aquabacterium sp.]|nr:alpha-hydroxy-acid oxidizing protein [Aquabacterium sp.]